MLDGVTTYPADVPVIAEAIFAVARSVLAAEDTPGAPYPAEPLPLPPIEATPAYARVLRAAGLDATATLVFRILIAAELDRHVARVIRRLGGDPSRAAVPVDGLLAVVEGLGVDAVAATRALRPTAPLIARGLVEVLDPTAPPLAQRVIVPPAVIDFLVTGEAPPPRAPFVVEPAREVHLLCPLRVRGGDPDLDAATLVRSLLPAPGSSSPLWLVGLPGSGRRTLLAAVAAELGKRLVCVAQGDLLRITGALPRLWREIILGDAILCVHDAEPVVDAGGPEQSVRAVTVDAAAVGLAGSLVAAGIPVVFSSSQAPPLHAFDHPLRVVQLAPPRHDDAIALWERGLPEVAEVADLATRFRLPPGRIVRAVSAARVQAASVGRDLTAADVVRAIGLGVSQQVAVLGTLIEDSQTWDDIILPVDTRDSVRELVARVRHRHTVLDRWGFRGKLSKGLGVAALFHGPPGTGKTMVANLIAKELGQDLYQVDLSRMVSKWIGETEKNLAKVFDAAEGANVMLLFDEADSLFSKRTEVKSSNDRHSNAEINYLLQRVERFEGVCILTTNLEMSIDAAFKRRLAFRIEFPMPDERERTRLWQRMVPASTTLAPDVDFTQLATEYQLAGGNIRNALLRAAFLSADAGGPITMELLQRAVKLEYRDAGKLGTTGTIYGH